MKVMMIAIFTILTGLLCWLVAVAVGGGVNAVPCWTMAGFTIFLIICLAVASIQTRFDDIRRDKQWQAQFGYTYKQYMERHGR